MKRRTLQVADTAQSNKKPTVGAGIKTYAKSVLRSFRGNTAKIVSIAVIIFLGIAFVAGLGTLSPTIKDSVNRALVSNNVPDLVLKSKSESGFSAEELDAISNSILISDAEAHSVMDIKLGGDNLRIYVLDGRNEIGALGIDGRMPESADEIAVERASDTVKQHGLNDTVSFFGKKFTVVGIVSNPLLFERSGEPDLLNQLPLTDIFYVGKESIAAFGASFKVPVTDLYVRLKGFADRDLFSDFYRNGVDEAARSLEEEFGDGFAVLTLRENKSFAMIEKYCEKVTVITLIFPIFFIAVAALVVLTSMTRMIEEERPMIACLKSLGVGDPSIAVKYLAIAGAAAVAASVLGLAVGLFLLPNVIYPAFNVLFFMPPMSAYLAPAAGLIAFAAMFAAVIAVTFYVSLSELHASPAALMLPKVPKAGKVIFLERIGFIWKRLPFRFKSAFRNVIRNKKHLIMTVVSVAGSTALVFAGFALLNVADALSGDSLYAGLKDSLSPIALVVVAFALLLTVFVVYNLTNMNIAERKREIATLKVLGYHEPEVAGYVYREILITAVAGAILGVAFGCGLIAFVLNYLEFGSLNDVVWYSYLVSPFIVVLFVAAVDMLLYSKIKAVNMTESLKSVD